MGGGGIQTLIYLNESKMIEKVNKLHADLGHADNITVHDKLKNIYFHPGLMNLIKYQLDMCVPCARYNVKKCIKNQNSVLMATQPGRALQIDYFGPICQSFSYRYVLGLKDAITRVLNVYGMRSTGAEELGTILTKHFSTHGVPEFVVIDHKCVSFRAIDKKLLDGLKVGVMRSNNRSVQQAIIERTFRTLVICILKLLNSETDLSGWYNVLHKAEYLLNVMPRSSPFELVYRHPPRIISALSPLAVPETGGEKAKEGFVVMNRMHEMMKRAAVEMMVKNKNYFYPNEGLKEGTIAFHKRMSFSKHMDRKLQTKVLSAHIIKRRIGTCMYQFNSIQTVYFPT